MIFRQPGCLLETLGFPSHPRGWFSIIVHHSLFVVIYGGIIALTLCFWSTKNILIYAESSSYKKSLSFFRGRIGLFSCKLCTGKSIRPPALEISPGDATINGMVHEVMRAPAAVELGRSQDHTRNQGN
jgi:hypothetical protein